MRKNAIFFALLVVAVGVTLGATVFRTDIAQATGLAQSVTVANTPAQAVPVREQATPQPWAMQLVINSDYTVPTGKTLVIEYVNAASTTEVFAFRAGGIEYDFLGTVDPECTTCWHVSEAVSIRLSAGAVLHNLTSNPVTLSGFLAGS